MERRNQHLDYLTDPSFQGLNRIFVWSFEDNAHRLSHKPCFLPTVLWLAEKTDQTVKNNLKTYDSIWKIATSQRDDCTTGRLLDYPYFKKPDPRAIQQISVTGNLNRNRNKTMFLILEKVKETIWDFPQKTVRVS